MAVTLDFGSCSQCNENNAKSTELCRKCGAPLPWSKAAKTASKVSTAPASSSWESSSSSMASSGSSMFTTGFFVQLLGMALCIGAAIYYVLAISGQVHFVRGPGWISIFLGRLIWKAGSNMDAE